MTHARSPFVGCWLMATVFAFVVVLFYRLEDGDAYPIYYGAQVLLRGESPYSEGVTRHLAQAWAPGVNKKAVPVIAYPMPVMISFIPLALLPPMVASFVWIWVSVFLVSVSLGREKLQLALLPLFFLPFYQTLLVQNVSLMWCGLSFLLLSRKAPCVSSGVLLALLLFKPQEGIVVALYCLYRWRHERSVVLPFVGSLVLLLLASFYCLPTWVTEWLSCVRQYSDRTVMIWLGALALVLALPGIPVTVRVVGLQALLFPLNDLYRTTLLLYGWAQVKLIPQLLVLASFSALLWGSDFNSPSTLLCCVVLPFLLVVILGSRRDGIFEDESADDQPTVGSKSA
jgi:hypothetical protein